MRHLLLSWLLRHGMLPTFTRNNERLKGHKRGKKPQGRKAHQLPAEDDGRRAHRLADDPAALGAVRDELEHAVALVIRAVQEATHGEVKWSPLFTCSKQWPTQLSPVTTTAYMRLLLLLAMQTHPQMHNTSNKDPSTGCWLLPSRQRSCQAVAANTIAHYAAVLQPFHLPASSGSSGQGPRLLGCLSVENTYGGANSRSVGQCFYLFIIYLFFHTAISAPPTPHHDEAQDSFASAVTSCITLTHAHTSQRAKPHTSSP